MPGIKQWTDAEIWFILARKRNGHSSEKILLALDQAFPKRRGRTTDRTKAISSINYVKTTYDTHPDYHPDKYNEFRAQYLAGVHDQGQLRKPVQQARPNMAAISNSMNELNNFEPSPNGLAQDMRRVNGGSMLATFNNPQPLKVLLRPTSHDGLSSLTSQNSQRSTTRHVKPSDRSPLPAQNFSNSRQRNQFSSVSPQVNGNESGNNFTTAHHSRPQNPPNRIQKPPRRPQPTSIYRSNAKFTGFRHRRGSSEFTHKAPPSPEQKQPQNPIQKESFTMSSQNFVNIAMIEGFKLMISTTDPFSLLVVQPNGALMDPFSNGHGIPKDIRDELTAIGLREINRIRQVLATDSQGMSALTVNNQNSSRVQSGQPNLPPRGNVQQVQQQGGFAPSSSPNFPPLMQANREGQVGDVFSGTPNLGGPSFNPHNRCLSISNAGMMIDPNAQVTGVPNIPQGQGNPWAGPARNVYMQGHPSNPGTSASIGVSRYPNQQFLGHGSPNMQSSPNFSPNPQQYSFPPRNENSRPMGSPSRKQSVEKQISTPRQRQQSFGAGYVGSPSAMGLSPSAVRQSSAPTHTFFAASPTMGYSPGAFGSQEFNQGIQAQQVRQPSFGGNSGAFQGRDYTTENWEEFFGLSNNLPAAQAPQAQQESNPLPVSEDARIQRINGNILIRDSKIVQPVFLPHVGQGWSVTSSTLNVPQDGLCFGTLVITNRGANTTVSFQNVTFERGIFFQTPEIMSKYATTAPALDTPNKRPADLSAQTPTPKRPNQNSDPQMAQNETASQNRGQSAGNSSPSLFVPAGPEPRAATGASKPLSGAMSGTSKSSSESTFRGKANPAKLPESTNTKVEKMSGMGMSNLFGEDDDIFGGASLYEDDWMEREKRDMDNLE